MTEDHEAAAVAKGLTKAQDKAMRDAATMNSILYGPDAFEVRAGGATIAMCKKGLIHDREWRGFSGRSRRGYALTPLGLRVRAHLQGETA